MIHVPVSNHTWGWRARTDVLCAKHRPYRTAHRSLYAHRCFCQQDTKERGTPGLPSSSNNNTSSGPSPGLGDPAQTVVWGGRLPSRRRAITGGLSALGIVLASNFAGSTSALLSLDGGRLAGRLKADALFPVAGYKRCLDTQNGYEFRYPARWLSDQRLYQRYAERVERSNGLDPPSLSRQRRQRNVTEPTAAYGPPGSSGEENLSVVVAPIAPGFVLESLGDARHAGERFLSTTVAPEGSGREAQLLGATERRDKDGELYYSLEFTVRSPNFFRHNLSVYATRNDLLYTLNGQCPQPRWDAVQRDFQVAAESFRVLSSRKTIPGWGNRLLQ